MSLLGSLSVLSLLTDYSVSQADLNICNNRSKPTLIKTGIMVQLSSFCLLSEMPGTLAMIMGYFKTVSMYGCCTYNFVETVVVMNFFYLGIQFLY